MREKDWLGYFRSLGSELLVQANRVRDLIGSAHWYSDGHHKEYLLQSLLRRHLPSGVIVQRGFVINPRETERVSMEQDLLVVDCTSEAPVFLQGGLVVALPSSVIAAVSVKTRMNSTTVKEALRGLDSVRVACSGVIRSEDVWCGGYFFRSSQEVRNDASRVREYVEQVGVLRARESLLGPLPLGPELLATALDLNFVFDDVTSGDSSHVRRMRAFRSKGMATAAFLGLLLSHVCRRLGRDTPEFMQVLDHGDPHFDLLGSFTIGGEMPAARPRLGARKGRKEGGRTRVRQGKRARSRGKTK